MARRRRSRKRAAQTKGGMTLVRVSLIAFALFVFIFAVTLWLSQQISYSQISNQQREAKGVVSRSVSFQLSQAVGSYAHSLESMARDPALV